MNGLRKQWPFKRTLKKEKTVIIPSNDLYMLGQIAENSSSDNSSKGTRVVGDLSPGMKISIYKREG